MKDKTLLKLSLIFSLLGLTLLIALTEFVQPKPLPIAGAIESLDEFVYTEGEILSITPKPKVVFITLGDETGEILVVLFDKLDKDLKEKDIIGVSGDISLYRGTPEIIAGKIFCIKCGK